MFVLKTAGGCGRSPSAIRQTRTCRRSGCLTPPRHLAVSILPPRENSRFPDPFPKVRLFRIKKPLVGAEGVEPSTSVLSGQRSTTELRTQVSGVTSIGIHLVKYQLSGVLAIRELLFDRISI